MMADSGASSSKDGESNNEESDEFPFENENMALKGNKDYLNLLRTLAVLESQRIKAIQDIDMLLDQKEKALEDPVAYAKKLERGEDCGIPLPQTVPDLPEIDWTRYKIMLPPEAFRPQTRNLGQRHMNSTSEKNVDSEMIKVRGRVYDPSKPVTFNQLWTVEEQLKLEELLVKYPPEDNEMRRYTKIAEELGNRTPLQVSSRCQKYFRKLQLAGLPIPGRVPKTSKSETYKTQKYSSHKYQRNSSSHQVRSTFFPMFHPPVLMTEETEQDKNVQSVQVKVKTEVEEDTEMEVDNIPVEMKQTNEYRKLVLLKRIRKDNEIPKNGPPPEHYGYKCDDCGDDPLVGTRWHCEDCDQSNSVDFCSDCLVSQLDSDKPHPLSHKFVAIRRTAIVNPVFDPDYSFQCYSDGSSTSYNYLDPNFMPH